ncbi:acyltransferase family protein [Thermomonospora echinospora]|nr:acyltransferase family protein [Thermomonospora echinospora]
MPPSPETLERPTPSKASAGGAPPRARAGHRPEIQGLRAVAVLLVAVYHIWLGRVSGGVDVFLMLTGFLITGSLLRTVERKGRVEFLAFAARLARRLFPPAAIVLAGVLAGTLLWLPQDRWQGTLAEVIASAAYYENWRLATTAVDYLAGGDGASPVQHFWSLAIQGQFYLLWPLLLAVATIVAVRVRRSPRAVFTGMLGLVFAGSLLYSVVRTATEQRWAYFDTGARLWELALGGLVALALARWDSARLPRPLRVVLGWGGLVALVACGLLLQVSTVFPGYAALWPTGAAVLIIVAGTTGSRFGADRLLSTRPLTYVGDISYALYLWHWPLFIFYLAASGRSTASLAAGSVILAASFLLAVGTTWLSDRSVGWASGRRSPRAWSFALGLACLAPVVMAAGGGTAYLDEQARRREAQAADPANYPGAAALTGAPAPPGLPFRPDLRDAKQDRSLIEGNGCLAPYKASAVRVCEYGHRGSRRTLALVGNSHAAHWFPALHKAAENAGWRLVTMVKAGCALTAGGARYPDTGQPYPECDAWSRNVMTEVRALRPDFVITIGTRTDPSGRPEELERGGVPRWRQLRAARIRVLAIRDTPRLTVPPSQCFGHLGLEACAEVRYRSLAKVSPHRGRRGIPANVRFVDLSRYVCAAGRCPMVIGNVLVVRDRGHFTETYARTLAPMVEREIRRAAGW